MGDKKDKKICSCAKASKVNGNVLEAIGKTPLVKLNVIPQSMEIKCDVLVKIESFNPGGSVKDRIAMKMVEEAEKSGQLQPDMTIIEPTSGNTGIGLALICAIKGYRCILVMSEKNSVEKMDTMRALGAEVVTCPIDADIKSPQGIVKTVDRLKNNIPNSIVLDQYSNPNNPLAHYESTAAEIYGQTDGNVDMIVAGAGTGGTITGLARFFKEKNPDVQIVGVDPMGSVLAQPDEINETHINRYEVEGIGHDYVPPVLDRSLVDRWVKVTDEEAFPMARRLIREEGILSGGSSGAALAAALDACRDLEEGKRCVVVLPDGIRNYMSKFLCDSWMIGKGLMPATDDEKRWWWDNKVSILNVKRPEFLKPDATSAEVIAKMKETGFEYMPVMDPKSRESKGIVPKKLLMSNIIGGKVRMGDPVLKSTTRMYSKVNASSTLGRAYCMLERENFVAIEKCACGSATVETYIVGFITMADLFEFISQNKAMTEGNQRCKRGV